MPDPFDVQGIGQELAKYGLMEDGYVTSGDIWFVDSGATHTLDKADSYHGKSWKYPFATIEFAKDQCTASAGDVIYVAAGHTETVLSAGAMDLDVIGITIIGLGRGNLRPTITVGAASTAGADIDIDAAEITVKNLIFKMALVDVTKMIDVNADGFTMENCEVDMHITVGTFQAVTGVDIDGGAGGADRTTIKGCTFLATLAAGTNQAIELGEANNRVVIDGCTFWGDYGNACVHNPTNKTLTDLLIKNCIMENDNAGGLECIELVSACTGYLIRNTYKSAITQATAVDPGSCFSIECYHDDVIDKSGVLCPSTT